MLLMTETNLDMFHAQLLAPQDAPAMDQLCAACGTPGGPDTAALLQTNAVLGDYAGTDTLQAAMGMLPMFGQSRLALADCAHWSRMAWPSARPIPMTAAALWCASPQKGRNPA